MSTPRTRRRAAVPYVATRRDGISFSKAMRPATSAIQTTLITPSANSDAINAQQQPTHQAPCRAPICMAPESPSLQLPRRKPSGRTALSETHVLEGGQLVYRSNEERAASDPTPCAVPREHVTEELSADPCERIGQEPYGAPHEEVAGGEEERGAESSRVLQLRVESHGRRDRGEHHRGHHHDPYAEEPGDRSELGPRAAVHVPHLARRPPPADSGECQEQRNESEAGARCRVGGGQPASIQSSLVRGGGHLLKQPRRTLKRAPFSLRIRSQTR